MNNKFLAYLLSAMMLCASFGAHAEDKKLTVFAAASLTNVLSEITAQYEKEKSIKVVNSFAASSALAKQIENGAPADIFMSADTKWMNYLQDKKRIEIDTRTDLLGNRLVLIAPKGKTFKVDFTKVFDLSKAFDGRLCTGELDSVPVGIYAKKALNNLGWWDAIKTRIVGTQDVRAALVFVERGECTAGIVYETDAKVSSKVDIVGVFPESTHDPIIYPVAMVINGQPASLDFLQYLVSPAVGEIFSKYGFTLLKK
ncbi:molybdate ABC transporter substrate-binding protein [Methylovorus sp. MM2]|uniref:molybdate ABC transporter substrate-binding protein n=1 Tax=Methylovorus sp. MM2 TaxID=1848038 RepID=UPI0007E26495|nr:molybdate ABC transporter substrate-binding protein [Methylovorus sp. MM2]OAM52300.1 molybdate ABC transporter substrate-binding protein [Methylovorus sp. MM2]